MADVNLPNYTYISDPNTGFYTSASNTMSFVSHGEKIMEFSTDCSEDPMRDIVFTHWTNLYILGRISKEEMVNRILKAFPDMEGNRLAELIEQTEEDKEKFFQTLKDREKVSKEDTNEKPTRDHSPTIGVDQK